MSLAEVLEELQVRSECRNLRDGDVFDPKMKLNIYHSDPEWVWVLVKDGKIEAAIVAAPYHGAVFVGQIVSTEDVPLVLLLRKFLSDIEARGFPGLFSFLGTSAKERKLISILNLAGGDILPESYSMVYLRVPTERKW